MKTIGLIGGMSWESSAEYYRFVNLGVKRARGGLHSAQSLMYSVDFAEIEEMQRAGDWDRAGAALAAAAQSLERGGAECVVLCTNTMHKVSAAIEAAVAIPLLHIADPTGRAVRNTGLSRVGLLGTRFTMEQDFYRQRLTDKFGLEVIVPDKTDRDIVHRVIYDELCLGTVLPESKREYLRIIGKLESAGAGGVILGCTEIGLLVRQSDTALPVFDTTALHAQAAVDFALA